MSHDLTLIIGNKNTSSWSLRPWLLMRMAGIPFTEKLIRLRRPETRAEILRHCPSGMVPALVIGEDWLVWDTLAIFETLYELFPDAGVWPKNPEARALARSIAAEMHAGFPSLRRHMPMDIVHDRSGEARRPEVAEDIQRVFDIWNGCADRCSGEGRFLFGDFCAADAMFAPVVTRLTTYGFPLDPAAADYVAAVWDLAPMAEWKAAAQQEAAAGWYEEWC